MIKVFTDGSCLKNPGGAGGIGIVIIYNPSDIQHISVGYRSTTNNRMELMAAVHVLNRLYLEGIKDVHIFSDSKYVVDSASKYIKTWRRNNFKNGEIANIDLWKCADYYLQNMNCLFSWVKAHNGDTYNEMADRLALSAAQNPTHIDVSYEEGNI